MAESEGFEPSIGDKPYTPLAGARLQPTRPTLHERAYYTLRNSDLKAVIVSNFYCARIFTFQALHFKFYLSPVAFGAHFILQCL